MEWQTGFQLGNGSKPAFDQRLIQGYYRKVQPYRLGRNNSRYG